MNDFKLSLKQLKKQGKAISRQTPVQERVKDNQIIDIRFRPMLMVYNLIKNIKT